MIKALVAIFCIICVWGCRQPRTIADVLKNAGLPATFKKNSEFAEGFLREAPDVSVKNLKRNLGTEFVDGEFAEGFSVSGSSKVRWSAAVLEDSSWMFYVYSEPVDGQTKIELYKK